MAIGESSPGYTGWNHILKLSICERVSINFQTAHLKFQKLYLVIFKLLEANVVKLTMPPAQFK